MKCSYTDDEVNFTKLRQEFDSAKHADEKYRRENDAKFRAVHQKVASYEEFRDIVAASHLKPLERDDITGVTSTKQPWNRLSGNHRDNGNVRKTETSSSTKTIESIKTRSDFLKLWKNLTEDKARVEFLSCFDVAFLEYVFECDIPLDFMETSTKCLLLKFTPEISQTAKRVLSALSKSARFLLSLKFLSKQDKENLNALFIKMKENGDKIDGLMETYNQ